MKQINLGFLGSGSMAGIHAALLKDMVRVSVSGVCGNRQSAKNFSEKHANCTLYPDFYTMIDSGLIDAVIITLPPYAHGDEVTYAAKKDISVFIEKPIALTLEKGAEMSESTEKYKIVSQTGFHMRFGGAVKKLKEMISSGKAGIPTLFDARYQCNSLHTPWWRDVNKSGGQIFEQVIHLYDLSQHFLGKASSVTAFKSNLCHKNIKGYTVEDTSVASIRHESGALSNIAATNCAVQWSWDNPFTCVCEKVTVIFKDANNARFIYTDGENPVIEDFSSDNNMYEEELKNFISSLRGEDAVSIPVSEGFSALTLVSAASESDGKTMYI